MPRGALRDGCVHPSLQLEPSSHSAEAGYRNYTPQQLANASGNGKKGAEPTTSFPRPLILPGDDLSEDPRCPPQSLRSWVREPERNEVTSRRNVVYVASPPAIDCDVKMMEGWTDPQNPGSGRVSEAQEGLTAQSLKVDDVEAYLRAFFTGMKVSTLSPGFSFSSWNDSGKSKARSRAVPDLIGLQRLDEVVGIRARPCPDNTFKAQLNLNDILDAAISALPDNAYALLLIVHHDLFEDEDDDFCCGRAYGGSRVAVVSSSRYNPCLDEVQAVEREHAWPASHCAAYVNTTCETASEGPRPSKKSKKSDAAAAPKEKEASTPISSEKNGSSPMQAAVSAHHSLRPNYSPHEDYHNLWLGRLCRTASHELGHCFGMAHCVYYACVMQSTASLAEDARQPPYLCPVDLAKLLRATGPAKRSIMLLLGSFAGHERIRICSLLLEFGLGLGLGS
ncbi:hypothetical protein G7Y79_00042g078190 [Physcia stellaris]|nr:hypothetical protein G7Y79_00042g078190 [Physcia stellaris]